MLQTPPVVACSRRLYPCLMASVGRQRLWQHVGSHCSVRPRASHSIRPSIADASDGNGAGIYRKLRCFEESLMIPAAVLLAAVTAERLLNFGLPGATPRTFLQKALANSRPVIFPRSSCCIRSGLQGCGFSAGRIRSVRFG